jgi:L-lactate dehydrogenase complex protein LldG
VNTRALMLGRIRAALADVPAGEPAAWQAADDPGSGAAYRRCGPGDAAYLAEMFAERCGEYQARVSRCGDDASAIARAIRDAVGRRRVSSLLLPAGLPPGWIPAGLKIRVDDPARPPAELDEVEGVLTGCALAIAQTGTIALDGGPGQGRRALTLIPDLHICIVRAGQIVFGVAEAMRALGDTVRTTRRPLTLISGPSATSDIELVRVEGVHGPRQLEVIVTAPPAPAQGRSAPTDSALSETSRP